MNMNLIKLLALPLLLALSTAAAAEGTRYHLQIEGMACEVCAGNVERRLQEIEGVIPDSVEVDLSKDRARLDVESGVELDDKMLDNLIRKAGYTYHGKQVESAALQDEDA